MQGNETTIKGEPERDIYIAVNGSAYYRVRAMHLSDLDRGDGDILIDIMLDDESAFGEE